MIFGIVLFFILGESALLTNQLPQIKNGNGSSCSPPTFGDCPVSALTAPLHGRFSIYCIVHSSQRAGTLVTAWSREKGAINATRTTITEQGKLDRNVSICIRDVQKSDEDRYVLKATNKCGEQLYSTEVCVELEAGGCRNYEPPNATHIACNDTNIVVGEAFSVSCLFNGDVNSTHYEIVWSVDGTTIEHYPTDKYREVRKVNCPSDTPCCSFVGILEVSNADTLDSGLYSCTAVPVTEGKRGLPLSLYIMVNPHYPKDALDVDLIAGVSSGGAILFAVVIICVASVICMRLQRKQRKKQIRQLLINEGSSYYGSVTQSLPTTEARPSLVTSTSGREESIFILYALELETYYNIKNEDCPAYNLIVDFIQFLSMVNISCYHDAYESFSTATSSREFSNKVRFAVQRAKTVVVVCSEVLYAAFMECDSMVQMKYGRFRAESILEIVVKSPKKFVPVFLASECSVCTELQGERSYNLRDFERFMEEANEGKAAEILKKPEYSELQDFVARL